MIALLTDEALAHGSADLLVQQIGDWWVLASSKDWLAGDIGAFFSPVPDPVRGPNTSRVEVLLTAFCLSTWTAVSGDRFDVSVTGGPPDEVSDVLETSRWRRVVAFLPPTAPTTEGGETDGLSRHLQLVPDDLDLSPAYDDAFSTLPGKLEQAGAARTEQ